MGFTPAEEFNARKFVDSRRNADGLNAQELAYYLHYCRRDSSPATKNRARAKAWRLLQKVLRNRPLIPCPYWYFRERGQVRFRSFDHKLVRLDPLVFPVYSGYKYEMVRFKHTDHLSFGQTNETRYLVRKADEPQTMARWCFVTFAGDPCIRYVKKVQLKRREFDRKYPGAADLLENANDQVVPELTIQMAAVGKVLTTLVGTQIAKEFEFHGFVDAIVCPSTVASLRDFTRRRRDSEDI